MNLVLFVMVSIVSIAMCDVEVVSESITGYPRNPDIQDTSFACSDKPGDGFYADVEAKCQSFHMCQGGKFESFMCPTGTTFSQKGQVCDFWYNVDCSTTSAYYNQPASLNVDSLDTVVDYQTIHEDGFVVPPKPITESESVVEDFFEPVPVTIEPGTNPINLVPVIPLVEPPIEVLETGVPVIQPIEAIAKPAEIPVIQPAEVSTAGNHEAMSIGGHQVQPIQFPTIESNDEASIGSQEVQPLQIPTIESIGNTLIEGQEVQPVPIPSIESNGGTSIERHEVQPVEIPTIESNGDTSIADQEVQPVDIPTNVEASIIGPEVQLVDMTTIETNGQEAQSVQMATIGTDQVTSHESEENSPEPNPCEGKIPEPIVEDGSLLEDNDQITFPENDDTPFFDPIDHKASDIAYPSSDIGQEKADHYVFPLPPIEFLQHAEIDVAKPLPSMEGVRSLPVAYHSIPQPRVSLFGQEVKATKRTSRIVDVPQPKMHIPGDEIIPGDVRISVPIPEVEAPQPIVQSKSQLFRVPQPIVSHPKPFIEYKPILYKMGHTMRILKPIIKAFPFLYKVPSAVIGNKSAPTQSSPVHR